MKRNEPESIADVLRQTIREANMERNLLEAEAMRKWKIIVGQHIYSMAKPIEVKNSVMIVSVANAALRHELSMTKTSLIGAINDALSQPAISDIRFIG